MLINPWSRRADAGAAAELTGVRSAASQASSSARDPACPGRDTFGLALLFAVTALSRLPFLGAGYGLDPDAQRVVLAARTIRESGSYAASRLPGYPVQESLVSLLEPAGVWAVNGMSAFMSCLSSVFFALCLREFAVPCRLELALALAAVPVVYVNSTCAMDYVWALAFALMAAFFALRQRPGLAGLCVGLAIGTRITSGAMLLPIALLLAAKSPSRPATLRSSIQLMTLTAAGVGATCYVPLLLSYGPGFFSYDSSIGAGSIAEILHRATGGVWGLVGCGALAWAIAAGVFSAGHARARSAIAPRYWATAACLSAIALYGLAYIRLPHDAGYLVPVVPFTIWLAALWLTRIPAMVFAALLWASPFIAYRDGRLALQGHILTDHTQRAALERTIRQVVRAVDALPPAALIVAGYRLPALQVADRSGASGSQRYRYSIANDAEFAALQRAGHDIYYVDAATREFQSALNGLDLARMGARVLPIGPAAAE
jgi:hypothetical protein